MFLFTCLKNLHETYNKDLGLDEFKLYVLSNCLDKDKDVLESLLMGLEEATIDDLLLGDILTTLRNKKLAYDLALVSLDVSEGRSSVDKIFSTVEQFENKREVEVVEFVSGDLNDLYNNTVKQQGFRWRLKTLNRMLGSLRKGDFGFIFARPETGKTTFLACEITFFAEQVKSLNDAGIPTGPILWFK